MNYTINEIESAIVSALSGLLKRNGGDIMTIAPFGGAVESLAKRKTSVPVVLPALLVRYTGSVYKPNGSPMFEKILRFSILHAAANLASEENAIFDVRKTLDETRSVLNNDTLDLDIMPFVIVNEKLLHSDSESTIYSADYETSFLEDATLYKV